MRNVVFVVPYAMESTLRFVRGACALEGVQLSVVSQEPPARLPEGVRKRLVAHERVADCLDAEQLTRAVRKLAAETGGEVHALIGILEPLQETLAEVREVLGIRGMDRREARNFRDKSRMKDVLRQNDVPCAKHALAHSRAEALAFAESCGFPLVAKPPAGAGARNTLRVESTTELEGYLRTMPPSAQKPLLLEEFIQGREHSFDAVSINGEHVFHSISHYHPTPLEVMEAPWIQWCVLLPREISGDEYDDIRAAGKQTLSALGMVTGMTHMEWFRRKDGSIAVSEVAARPPGAQFTSLISYAHDRDFYTDWAKLCVFETFDVPPRKYACGAAYLRGQGQGDAVRAVEGLEAAQRELGDLVVEAKLPQVGSPAASSYEGEGFVILRHPETRVVEEGLRRAVELIRVRLG